MSIANAANAKPQVDLNFVPDLGLSLASTSDRLVRFKNAITRIAALGDGEGLNITPYHDERLPLFSELEASKQEEIIQNCVDYLAILEATKEADKYLLCNPNTLWRILGKLRLRSSPDLFEKLSANDVVEVYDRNCKQMFCSFNFFRICSYTLEELYSIPWYLLYKRDPLMTEANLTAMNQVFEFPECGTYLTSIPLHEVVETRGSRRRITTVRHRFCSPLFEKNGEVTAFVNAFVPERSKVEYYPTAAGSC